MAGPTKKPRKPTEPQSDDKSMSDESESGTYQGQQEVQATFEGRNPEGQDFHGIKQLLLQLFLKAHIDLSQMSDMLISQTGIGSVLKQSYDDDEDEDDNMDLSEDSNVFGITSVINLTSHRETPCVQQFFTLLEDLTKQHANKGVQDNITKVLQSKKLGFLINERFVNIPAKISAAMLNSLLDEMERIKKKNSSYDFDYLIIICKTCKSKGGNDDEEIYSNDEEELFTKAADATFDFCVEKETDVGLGGKWLSEDKQMIPYRRVVIFKGSKFKDLVSQISILVQ
ncbi:protein BCCIP homolog [Sitophilus oryzae]|uniref:Protein BCCIP homolog n=1 Tax=Sitophilus oryzae TaxID=7048 RepID=A0A6J2XXQ0_SITOR|nr:protein BCCIP homolog [Sitophilus oryzae]